MKQKSPVLLTILAWIHALLLFWCAYPFLATFSSYEDENFGRMAASGILLLIPIALSWILVPRVKHYLLYLLVGGVISIGIGSLASVAGGTNIMGLPLCGFLTGFLSFVIFLVHAIAKRRYGQMKQEFLVLHHEDCFPMQERDMANFLNHPHPGHLAVPTVLYFLAILTEHRECLPVMFALVLADVLVLAGYAFTDNFYEYTRQRQRTANMPTATMRRIHRFTGLAGLGILLLFMLPALLYGREVSVDTSGGSLFTLEPIESTINERRSATSQEDQLAEQQMSGLNAVTWPTWLRSLMDLLAYAIFAAAIVLVIISILKRMRQFKRDFAVEEEDEVINLDEGEEGIVRRILHRTKTEGDPTPNKVIRRRYRKAIRRALKTAPKRWGTPTEIEREAALDTDASMQNLHGYYEKARYSRDGCTQEDVQNCM